MGRHTAAAMLTICVPVALLARLIFRGARLNTFEALVFSLFVFGHAMIIHSILMPLAWLLGSTPAVYNGTLFIPVLLVGGYAAVGFFGRGRSALFRVGGLLRGAFAFEASYPLGGWSWRWR